MGSTPLKPFCDLGVNADDYRNRVSPVEWLHISSEIFATASCAFDQTPWPIQIRRDENRVSAYFFRVEAFNFVVTHHTGKFSNGFEFLEGIDGLKISDKVGLAQLMEWEICFTPPHWFSEKKLQKGCAPINDRANDS